MKKEYGIIISDYKAGAPIGPMLTARIYCQQLILSGFGGNILLLTSDDDVDRIRNDFHFANSLEIVKTNDFIPVILRSLVTMRVRRAIKNLYSKSKFVTVIWYPGAALGINRSSLKRSAIVMMDSQVKLIESTANPKGPLDQIRHYLRKYVYGHLERRIINTSPCVAFVSRDDVDRSIHQHNNIIFPKLPLSASHLQIPKPRALPPKILIPRPDIDLLSTFLSHLRVHGDFDIHVLLNSDLPSSCKNVKHTRYIENYEDFFFPGGLVVLLDKGGAGTTNRSIVVSKFGLPFIGTLSSTRGHDYLFPNCICSSDNIVDLAKCAAKRIFDIQTITSHSLIEYLKSFKPENAVRPLINKLKEINTENV